MSCTWASAFRMMTSSARSAAPAWSCPERSSRAPQPLPPRLAPLPGVRPQLWRRCDDLSPRLRVVRRAFAIWIPPGVQKTGRDKLGGECTTTPEVQGTALDVGAS